jgi:hypothetical protein
LGCQLFLNIIEEDRQDLQDAYDFDKSPYSKTKDLTILIDLSTLLLVIGEKKITKF